MLRWTWRELETYCIVVARQFSTLPMSGMWKRSQCQVVFGSVIRNRASVNRSDLWPPRHISTLHTKVGREDASRSFCMAAVEQLAALLTCRDLRQKFTHTGRSIPGLNTQFATGS